MCLGACLPDCLCPGDVPSSILSKREEASCDSKTYNGKLSTISPPTGHRLLCYHPSILSGQRACLAGDDAAGRDPRDHARRRTRNRHPSASSLNLTQRTGLFEQFTAVFPRKRHPAPGIGESPRNRSSKFGKLSVDKFGVLSRKRRFCR